MSFFDTLQLQTSHERQALFAVPVIREALAGQVSRASYIAFLTQAYYHVRHTVPLMMACGARLPARLEWLRGAVCEYIQESTATSSGSSTISRPVAVTGRRYATAGLPCPSS